MTLEEIVNNLKSAGQDYGQLFNNNPRMDATKQFGGRAINNINSAGEGYSQWQRLQDQNFGPNQSVIASGFMHPQKGLSKLADWFTNNVNTAAGLPDPNQQDEASMYAYGPNIEQQAESGLNLAGLLQTGAFASGAAPKSAGGTLGTFTGPKSMGWNHDAANTATKLLDNGADPAQVWKDHMILRMPDGSLQSEISDAEMSHVIPLNKWINKENGQSMAPNISTAWDEAASELVPNAPVRIKRLFEHEQLKKQYPYGFTKNYDNQSIMDMPVFMHEKNSQSSGSLGDGELTLHPSLPPRDAKSVTLHEIQHAIQEKEGWARGGSPSGYKTTIGVIDDLKQQLPFLKKEKSQLLDSFMNTYDESLQPKMQDLDRKISKYEDIIKNPDQNLSNIDELSRQYYRRLTGEAQARATQDRMNMNMQQRRDNYPLAGDKLSDIPLDQLINRYRDNGPSMSMSIKNPNLNFELLNKHLSGQKLTPEEMALYEKNGSAMETPQLQRYNLGNANAQGGSPESRAIDNGYNTDVYHGMSARRDFWGNSPDLIALDSNTGKAEGGRLFSSDDPRIASQYSGHRTETPIIYPLSIKDDSIFSAPIKNWDVDKGGTTLNGINIADDIGKNTALFKGVVDTPGYNPHNEFLSNVYASKKDIRSRFAAFDPLRKNSSSLLASGLLGSLLLKQMNQESSQQ